MIPPEQAMSQTIRAYMEAEHDRLDALLAASLTPTIGIDETAYTALRQGLLRHIAQEEKILFRAAQAAHGHPLPNAAELSRQHSYLARLLIVPPSREVLQALATALEAHNPLEEGEDGLYAQIDALGPEAQRDILNKLKAYPAVRPGPHRDLSW